MTPVPCYALTEADLERTPVWRFALPSERSEAEDESCVVPDPQGLRLGNYGSFIVHARFDLSNGATLPGAVQVDILGPKVFFRPTYMYVDGRSVDPFDSEKEHIRPERWTLVENFAGEAEARSARIRHSTFLQVLGIIAQLVSLRFLSKG